MMRRWILSAALWWPLLLAAQSSRTLDLSFSDPTGIALVMENPGPETVRFRFQLDGLPYSSLDQILEIIRRQAASDAPEDQVEAAWQFVAARTFNHEPRNEERRIHHPLIFLNSVGTGFCDDEAGALSVIWKAMGYQVRTWSLGGHVVPEVFYDGTWHMYDPSMKAYYLMADESAAGVEALQAQPEVVGRGVILGGTWMVPPASSHFAADYYRSREDNRVEPWFDAIPEVGVGDFRLPPGSRLRLHSAGRGSFLVRCRGRRMPRWNSIWRRNTGARRAFPCFCCRPMAGDA